MNERERLLNLFNKKKIDLIPWYGDLSWWYNSLINKDESYKGEYGYLKMHIDTRVGIYLYPPSLWKIEYSEDIKFIEEKNGDLIISKIITPFGELESKIKILENSFTTAYITHYIKKTTDLKVMQYIFKNRKIYPNYEEFERIDRKWDGYGIPVALGPVCVSPLQTLITRWAGIQKVIDIYIDNREILEETIEIIQDSDNEIFEIIENSPAIIVEFPENLSGEITGKNLIEKYELPYWKKRINQLHKKGKFVGIHNDGTLKGSLPLLVEAEFDFVEAVTPAPFGDLSIEEIFEIVDEKIIIWGGIPGAIFSPLYTEEYFEKYLKSLIQFVKEKKNFVLGVADQVPPDASFERVCKVREILEKYGR
jgi:uroporphyrinogen-III decarboxylase